MTSNIWEVLCIYAHAGVSGSERADILTFKTPITGIPNIGRAKIMRKINLVRNVEENGQLRPKSGELSMKQVMVTTDR